MEVYLSQPFQLNCSKGSFPNIRYLRFTCPCGKICVIMVTEGPHFSAEEGNRSNVWHYEIRDNKISTTPSIGLDASKEHTPACHIYITNQPFEYEET